MVIVFHDDNVCNVANPQLISCGWDDILDKVWVYRKAMSGVCSPGLRYSKPYLMSVLVCNSAEAVSAYRIVTRELSTIHVPYLGDAHAGVQSVNVLDILKSELFARSLRQSGIVIVLVIGLLAYANQSAKTLDKVASRVPCVQVIYCLAPAFFLIGILNFASATLIISL